MKKQTEAEKDGGRKRRPVDLERLARISRRLDSINRRIRRPRSRSDR